MIETEKENERRELAKEIKRRQSVQIRNTQQEVNLIHLD